jgi:hypothetical protein
MVHQEAIREIKQRPTNNVDVYVALPQSCLLKVRPTLANVSGREYNICRFIMMYLLATFHSSSSLPFCSLLLFLK